MTKSNANRRRQPGNLHDAETDSTLRPGDYPLGSLQSRAAARVIVDSSRREETVIQVVFVSPDGTTENGPVYTVPASSRQLPS